MFNPLEPPVPMAPRFLLRSKRLPNGFSLVEVVMALGILAFAVTALIGTLVVSMNAESESVEELEATHIMQSLLAERRSRPIDPDPDILLQPSLDTLTAAVSGTFTVDSVGRKTTLPQDTKFGVVFRVAPSGTVTPPMSADVYCGIYWPGQAAPANALGRVEIATEILLP